MFVSRHIFFGIILSILLILFFPTLSLFSIAIIFLSSVLIDMDHYFYFIFLKKNLSLKKAYQWYIERWKNFNSLSKSERKKIYSGFFMFHGIEILILLFFLGKFVSGFFLFVLIGFSFHMLLDIPDEIAKKGTVDKISLFYNYYRFRKLNH